MIPLGTIVEFVYTEAGEDTWLIGTIIDIKDHRILIGQYRYTYTIEHHGTKNTRYGVDVRIPLDWPTILNDLISL